ncbi:TusE/DsrC/DsvC family sulfur relay protein [secondary endosymbiont of Ctenarytaina eucalypti]|uniref:Sulfurtransferase n=1 Tax=secondary endosymbiont of Ctenarytaina eucalypti TaxID=1199245 RepID=J3VRE7_9ENTR|nr:TusE/DsrC/DsvC family sulfur relay protein [secondary endosymbiont of Ctenarytaina eucalypti]AFP84526.1 sulfur relay protein, TusE/DsrC/DsvC family [secondary endosymbiont of Ctenarytaina eucalypti]
MEFNGIEIKTDAQGYLICLQDWTEALAVEIARIEGITLSEDHWEVIHFVRAFYLQYNTSPAVRLLIKALSQTYGAEKGNSRYLFYLFSNGAASQVTKIAGLPKPIKCL